jgi:hypothetical protein
MSLYITWINLIKEKADENWLTVSQRAVYENILTRWRSAPFVNLCGPPGSGKTFIARLLAKKHGYYYTFDLQEAPEGAAHVILDDANYTRRCRLQARTRRLGRVLLITRHPISEAMPVASLELDIRDVQQFQRILSDYCGICFTATIPEGTDLTQILHTEVIKRGEAYVYR